MNKSVKSYGVFITAIGRVIVATPLLLTLFSCDGGGGINSGSVSEVTAAAELSAGAAQSGADLYLIFGQSNAAGRDIAIDGAGADAPLSEVQLFTEGNTFEIASQPLNKYSAPRKTSVEQGVNLGLEFGKAMVEHNGRTVYLVVNARGGTKVAEWRKDKENGYFDNTVQRVLDAQAACQCALRGILWHQGEGNASSDGTYTSSYFASLAGLVSEYRGVLGEVPFLVGQLYRKSANWSFNKDLQQVGSVDFPEANVDWVSSLNLTTLDGTHFDAASTRNFGARYAVVMQQFVE